MMRQSIAIAIDYLANCPEFLDALAQLSWKEWQEIYQQREQTLDDCLKNYRERTNTDRLPLTLVAVRAGLAVDCRELVGMVSLKYHDMDTRPDLDPWLGGLLVLPEWRNHGVGTMLMHRHRRGSAIEECRDSILDAFSRRLYRKLGWQVVERAITSARKQVVMQIDLSRQ
jgi:GNAT superfamily N-acetyltransferase